METETSRKIVLDYLSAQGRGDGDRIAELLADDVVWRMPASSGIPSPQSRAEVLQMMAEVGPKYFDLPTMKIEIKWIIAEDDKVIVRQRSQGKAANGRDYDNEYVWVYVCREGQIAEIEEHVDTKKFSEIVLE